MVTDSNFFREVILGGTLLPCGELASQPLTSFLSEGLRSVAHGARLTSVASDFGSNRQFDWASPLDHPIPRELIIRVLNVIGSEDLGTLTLADSSPAEAVGAPSYLVRG